MKELIIKILGGWTDIEYKSASKDKQKVIDELKERFGVIEKIQLINNESIETLTKEKAVLKEEIKKLLSAGKIDVNELKSFYENKYTGGTWKYSFNGDGKERDIKYALRTTKAGEKDIMDIVREIIRRYKVDTATEAVEATMRYFKLRGQWTYKYDKDLYGLPEFWAMAEKSAKSRQGDCDDLAILMHNVIYFMLKQKGMMDQYWRLKYAVGMLLGEGGHAFNIFLADDGEWYTVESTFDLKGSYDRTWLKTPTKNNNMYKSFWGFARKDRSWKGDIRSLESKR